MSLLEALQWGIGAVCLALAAWLLVRIALDRSPDRVTLTLLAAVEVALVVHLVVGVVHVLDAGPGVSVPAYVGYLVGVLLLVPAGVVWSSSERSRSATSVLVVALVLVPFLFLRLAQIWSAGA